jgi:hypothetical protein
MYDTRIPYKENFTILNNKVSLIKETSNLITNTIKSIMSIKRYYLTIRQKKSDHKLIVFFK